MSEFMPFDLVMEKLIYCLLKYFKCLFLFTLFKKKKKKSFIPQLSFRPLCNFQVSLKCGSITEVDMAIDNLLEGILCAF